MAFKLFNSKKEKISFAIFFIAVFLIPTLIFAAKQTQDIRQRAFEPTSSPASQPTILGFSYNEPFYGKPIAVGQTFGVSLEIDSPLDITAIESVINFDPDILEIVEISDITKDNFILNASSSAYSRPPFFEKAQIVKSEYSNSEGTVNYTILTSPEEDFDRYHSNIGFYGEIIFKAKKAGNTTINYTLNSAATAKGFGSQNVLNKTYPLSLNFDLKPQSATIPTTIKFSSLTSPIPQNLMITALITPQNTDNPQWLTVPLTPTEPGTATTILPIPIDKNYQITLHRPGFLDINISGYLKNGTTNHTIDTINTPFIPGDIDSNGIIDIFDYNIFVENFGKTTPTTPPNQLIPSDLDFSGKVDIFDYNIFIENFGKGEKTEYISFTNKWLDVNTNSKIDGLDYFILFVDFTMPKNKSGKLTGKTGNNNPCQGNLTGDTTYESDTIIKFTGKFTGQCRISSNGTTVPANGTFQGTYWTQIGYLKGTWEGTAETSLFGGKASGTIYMGDIQVPR